MRFAIPRVEPLRAQLESVIAAIRGENVEYVDGTAGCGHSVWRSPRSKPAPRDRRSTRRELASANQADQVGEVRGYQRRRGDERDTERPKLESGNDTCATSINK